MAVDKIDMMYFFPGIILVCAYFYIYADIYTLVILVVYGHATFLFPKPLSLCLSLLALAVLLALPLILPLWCTSPLANSLDVHVAKRSLFTKRHAYTNTYTYTFSYTYAFPS